MRVKISDLVDITILLIIYLKLVILEFMGFTDALDLFVSALILGRIVLLGNSKKRIKVLMPVVVFSMVFLLNLIINGVANWNIATMNYRIQLYPLVITCYILYLCEVKCSFVRTMMLRGGALFNITFIINMVVVVIQIIRPYSILGKSDNYSLAYSYYEDTISGLFKYASTHVLCFFGIFIIVYNLVMAFRTQNRSKKIRLIIITSVYTVFLLITSFYNDNKAFFLLLPIVLLFTSILSKKENNLKLYKRVFIAVISILTIFLLLYYLVDPFKRFVDQSFIRAIELVNGGINLGASAKGSNERFAIIGFALALPNTWFCGNGFGNVAMYHSNYLGFSHFGQSDIGSSLVLGGLWYFLVMVFLYTFMYRRIIIGEKNKNGIVTLSVFLLIIICLIYNQFFTRVNLSTCLFLIVLSFGLGNYLDSNNSNPQADKDVFFKKQRVYGMRIQK